MVKSQWNHKMAKRMGIHCFIWKSNKEKCQMKKIYKLRFFENALYKATWKISALSLKL